MFKKSLMLIAVFGFMFLLVACGDEVGNVGSSDESGEVINEDLDLPIVSIYVEGYGEIIAELYPQYAPITVHNFISLIEDGFYDGLTFHRILNGFMIQGGCPQGTGMGNSGTMITGEFSDNGIDNPLSHERGVLSMARAMGNYDSASSQFFIMHGTYRGLDGAYAAFGRVISGMEVVDSIVEAATPIDNNGTITIDEQPVIREIRLISGSQIELD